MSQIDMKDRFYYNKDFLSSSSGADPHRNLITAFCPPIGFAEPCRILAMVNPQPNCLYILISSAFITSLIRTSAVTD